MTVDVICQARPPPLLHCTTFPRSSPILPDYIIDMPSGDYLVWIDLEMTGLKPDFDAIIEIATVVTDKDLAIVAEGPVLAIHHSDEVLARMDEWNQRQHGSSGLLARRSEEHTSELQSRPHLVCRLLLEKKKKRKYIYPNKQKKKQTKLE